MRNECQLDELEQHGKLKKTTTTTTIVRNYSSERRKRFDIMQKPKCTRKIYKRQLKKTGKQLRPKIRKNILTPVYEKLNKTKTKGKL